MIVASLVATVTYSSIFMLVSLLISRALVAALIYLFVWESILGRFVPGLRYVSIRHFVASIFAAVAERSPLRAPGRDRPVRLHRHPGGRLGRRDRPCDLAAADDESELTAGAPQRHAPQAPRKPMAWPRPGRYASVMSRP